MGDQLLPVPSAKAPKPVRTKSFSLGIKAPSPAVSAACPNRSYSRSEVVANTVRPECLVAWRDNQTDNTRLPEAAQRWIGTGRISSDVPRATRATIGASGLEGDGPGADGQMGGPEPNPKSSSLPDTLPWVPNQDASALAPPIYTVHKVSYYR